MSLAGRLDCLAVCLVAIGASFAPAAQAQVLAPNTSVPSASLQIDGAPAMSDKAVAESLAVLTQLNAAIRTNRGDHAAWHRRGVVAGALARRATQPNAPGGLDAISLRGTADGSLRQAVKLAPSNARYAFDLGAFLQTNTRGVTRLEGYGYVQLAVKIGREGGIADTATHVDALIEVGIKQWLSREKLKETRTLASEATFFEAYLLAPSSRRAFDSYGRMLARREAWKELAGLSLSHIEHARDKAWPRLTLGLALQRSNDSRRARVVFDSALAMLTPDQRSRFDRVERIMRPSEAAEFARADSIRRALIERVVWLRDDPLWGREDASTRTEFLARLTYSELMGELAEVGAQPGARLGDAHVRYGPDPQSAQPAAPVQFDSRLGLGNVAGIPNFADIVSALDVASFLGEWRSVMDTRVVRPRDDFPGGGPPSPAEAAARANAIAAAEERARVRELTPDPYPWRNTPEVLADSARNRAERTPTRWANIGRGRIDSLPVQAARFRGVADSVDFYIASEANPTAIRGGVSNAEVRADLWLYGVDVDFARRDSIAPLAIGALRWSSRVPPGTYLYRVQASASGSLVAARATATMDLRPESGFRTREFGLSDVLLVRSAAVPDRLLGQSARWRDLSLTPLLAPADSGGTTTLVWENYEFGRDGISSRYDVSITMKALAARAGARSMAVQIVGGLAAAVGVNRNAAADSIVFQFEREVPFAAAFVDFVTLDLGDTQPGVYAVTLTLLDRVSGAASTRQTRLAIRSAQPRE